MKTFFIFALLTSSIYSQTTTIKSTVNIDGKVTNGVTTVNREGNTVFIDAKITSQDKYRADSWTPHTPMVRPVLNWKIIKEMGVEERSKAYLQYYELFEEFKEDEFSRLHDEQGNLIQSRAHHKLFKHNKNWTRKLVNGDFRDKNGIKQTSIFVAVPSEDYYWIWYPKNSLDIYKN